jgi:spore germination protein KC
MNHNRKLKAYLFIVCLLVLTLTGCGFKDIDKRIFVVSVGVDPAKRVIRSSLLV